MPRNLPPLLLLFPLLLALAGCQHPKPAEVAPAPTPTTPTEIRAFIPCGMIIPMRTAGDAFMKEHPGLKITGIYDNAGVIVKRINQRGEQADLVVSPGSTELKALQDKGHIASEARPIGTFELVIITPKGSKLDLKTPADLKKCKTIGSANPDTNSTGTSGKEALTKLGLWDELQPKFLRPYPDHAIVVYNMVEQTYMLRDGFHVIDICSYNGTMYMVNENRYVYRFGEGSTYDGAAIDAYWVTPKTDMDLKGVEKQVRWIYLRGEGTFIIIKVRVGISEQSKRHIIPKDEEAVLEISLLNSGRTIQLRIENEAGSYFRLTGGVEIIFDGGGQG